MRVKRSAAAVLLCFVLIATALGSGNAAPNGKAGTSEYIGGVGLLYALSQYFVAISKSAGSAHQGDLIVDAPATYAAPGQYSWSLRNLRDLIVYDVAAASTNSETRDAVGQWRMKFEHLRGCWNQILVQPAPSSGSDKSASPARGEDAGKGSPTKPCDQLSTDYKAQLNQASVNFDVIDLTSALSDKSLYAQVLDQNVGSYTTDNALRTLFLAYVSEKLALDINSAKPAAAAPGPAPANPYTTLLQKCLSVAAVTGAFDCISAGLSLEQTFAAQRSQHDACRFSRGVWMPSYTAIRQKLSPPPKLRKDTDRASGAVVVSALPIVYDPGNDPAALATAVRPDFGAAPGC